LAELYADGGVDAMENIFYPIEFRVKEEIGKVQGHIVQGGMISLKKKNGNTKSRHEYQQAKYILTLLLKKKNTVAEILLVAALVHLLAQR
jgi:hypothetical protein